VPDAMLGGGGDGGRAGGGGLRPGRARRRRERAGRGGGEHAAAVRQCPGGRACAGNGRRGGAGARRRAARFHPRRVRQGEQAAVARGVGPAPRQERRADRPGAKPGRSRVRRSADRAAREAGPAGGAGRQHGILGAAQDDTLRALHDAGWARHAPGGRQAVPCAPRQPGAAALPHEGHLRAADGRDAGGAAQDQPECVADRQLARIRHHARHFARAVRRARAAPGGARFARGVGDGGGDDGHRGEVPRKGAAGGAGPRDHPDAGGGRADGDDGGCTARVSHDGRAPLPWRSL
ncbi:MAG: hypothetical protein AVDCRST_MAG89-3104, partial [uncultured Gemmatimonadetes bacterium]